MRCSARAARRAPHRTAPGAAPPLSARAPPLSARAAYRAARGAAQRRAGRGRRAHRCAAPHRSPERTSAPRRAAAAHALSTSRSVLHTDHLRAAPSYFAVLAAIHTDVAAHCPVVIFGVVVEPGSLRTGRIWNWAPPLSRSSLSIEARYAQFLFMLLDGWESLFSSPRRPVH